MTKISWVRTKLDTVFEDNPDEQSAESVFARPQEHLLEWQTGQAEPPFVRSNAQAVKLALALATGCARVETPVQLSKAVAL